MPSRCYGCQDEVSEDRYCFGCGQHVCEGCDKAEEFDPGLPYHIHEVEEHAADEEELDAGMDDTPAIHGG